MNGAAYIGIGILLLLSAWIVAMKRSEHRLRRSVRFYEEHIRESKQEQYQLRAHKHDLLNHVNTIHALACMKEYDELRAYTERWTRDIACAFEKDDTGHPILAALLLTKQDEADRRDVLLTYKIERRKPAEFTLSPVDLVRMIGNLVDNAIDCAAAGPPDERWVRVEIDMDARMLRTLVVNPGKLPKRTASRMLDTGFTTKQSHSGYGLSIVQELSGKLGGSVYYRNKGGQITFHLDIPWSKQQAAAPMKLIAR
ncbi:sensor histidine kinase [Cohnella sp. GCM10027633]|uniref:sensor histidine kinase n=1 Tax=unclassified Cohnella TaxID=2636738 RepID=UPI00363D1BBF